MIVATAPGRCGLVGNPTDMYGGSVLSCSTQERAHCRLNPDADEIVITISGQRQTITAPADLALRGGDFLDIARGVLQALEINPGTTRPFHLQADTEIPMQAGLAGSTALLAALTGCLLAHLDLRLNPYETAELIRKIEYDILGIVCGFQDQYMTTFGGLNYMDFRGKDSALPQDARTAFATVEPLERYVGAELPVLLAHTGIRHHSGTVHKSVRQRWLEGEAAVVEGYQEVSRLAPSAKRALLSCDWSALADLMNRNHAVVRGLGGSGEANERLIEAALGAGALGAKLAGAGGGGTILALTLDPDRTQAALAAAGAEQILVPRPSPGLTVEVQV